MPPCLAAHVEEPELLRIVPELRLGLDVHLVHAAEAVEVVDVRAAEQRAERRVHVRRSARPASAPCCDRCRRRSAARVARYSVLMRPISGRFRAASMNSLRLLGQILGRAAAAILQLHREAGAGARGRESPAGRRRRRRASGICCANARLSARHDAVGMRLLGVPVVPRLELHEEEAHVRRVGAGQQR